MPEVKAIMCCCGGGMGTSLIMKMNVERALQKLGRSDITVDYAAVSDAEIINADLFIFGKDLANFTGTIKNRILLDNIMDMQEIETKLRAKLGV